MNKYWLECHPVSPILNFANALTPGVWLECHPMLLTLNLVNALTPGVALSERSLTILT